MVDKKTYNVDGFNKKDRTLVLPFFTISKCILQGENVYVE